MLGAFNYSVIILIKLSLSRPQVWSKLTSLLYAILQLTSMLHTLLFPHTARYAALNLQGPEWLPFTRSITVWFPPLVSAHLQLPKYVNAMAVYVISHHSQSDAKYNYNKIYCSLAPLVPIDSPPRVLRQV